MALAGVLLISSRWIGRAHSTNGPVAERGGAVLDGKTYVQREKIAPGITMERLSALLGKPTYHWDTKGESDFRKWVYVYRDGKLTIAIRDGYVSEIRTEFN
jgi:hypothetical protein